MPLVLINAVVTFVSVFLVIDTFDLYTFVKLWCNCSVSGCCCFWQCTILWCQISSAYLSRLPFCRCYDLAWPSKRSAYLLHLSTASRDRVSWQISVFVSCCSCCCCDFFCLLHVNLLHELNSSAFCQSHFACICSVDVGVYVYCLPVKLLCVPVGYFIGWSTYCCVLILHLPSWKKLLCLFFLLQNTGQDLLQLRLWAIFTESFSFNWHNCCYIIVLCIIFRHRIAA